MSGERHLPNEADDTSSALNIGHPAGHWGLCLVMGRIAEQPQLPFRVPFIAGAGKLEVLDLFAGLGGLSQGFRDCGFAVTGVDNESVAEEVFKLDKIGAFVLADLSTKSVLPAVPLVIGGPPCRPWSAVNLQLRKTLHNDHALLARFFEHINEIRPQIFVMENVVALKSDETYQEAIKSLRKCGFSIESRAIRYSEFGAATSRRRLFTVGVQGSVIGAAEYFDRLERRRSEPETVRSAISWAKTIASGAYPDHDWSDLKSIRNYDDRYESGQYGWKRLAYDEPAPSFGSIAKTYILHPDAGDNGFPLRVLSVREAMSIMGFDRSFQFPEGTPRAKRYQMVANAVSPVVARAIASVASEMLNGTPLPPLLTPPGASRRIR